MLKVIKGIQALLVRVEREETEVAQEVQDPLALPDLKGLVESLAFLVSTVNQDQKDRQVLQEGVASQEAQVPMDKMEPLDLPDSMVNLVLQVEMEELADRDSVVEL